MFKQSSYVLALFLGTSSAAQLTNSFATGMNGDEDMGEDITMKGDKFHFVQQMGANGCGKGELMTAGGNCLFQSEALQINADPAAEPKATATAATYPEPEKVHTLDPKIAKAHTTFYNGHKHVSDTYPANDEQMDGYVYDATIAASAAIPTEHTANAPSLIQGQNGVHSQMSRNGKDISEKKIDAEVQGMANTMVDRLNWPRSEEPFVPNGSKITFPSALNQRNGRDISEKKIDEDVQDFANGNVERQAWPRSEEQFVPNGSKVTFPAAAPVPAFYQRSGRDISEKKIDESVQDFANKNVERQAWPRSEEAFVPNGSQVTFPAASPVPAFYQRSGRAIDISEKNIDAEVHGLANANVDRMPWTRSDKPFVDNGSDWKFPKGQAYYQRNGRDISEKKIDAEVQGMANTMVDRLNWPRSEEPFVPNGSKISGFPAAPSLYQRNGRDISEKKIDAEVQGMANTMVDRLNWPRSEEPFVPNGSKITFPASLYQHQEGQMEKDIANKEVRPDVWVTVHKLIDPVAHWRGKKAPKSNYEDWWGEGPPPLQELEKPKCPEELEEEPNKMQQKLKKQAKKAKAKKAKEDAEMPGDIEEKKEAKDDAKAPAKGDAKDAKDEKKDEKEDAKEEEKKDEKEEDKKEEKKAELHQTTPPKSALVYDENNHLWLY